MTDDLDDLTEESPPLRDEVGDDAEDGAPTIPPEDSPFNDEVPTDGLHDDD